MMKERAVRHGEERSRQTVLKEQCGQYSKEQREVREEKEASASRARGVGENRQVQQQRGGADSQTMRLLGALLIHPPSHFLLLWRDERAEQEVLCSCREV